MAKKVKAKPRISSKKQIKQGLNKSTTYINKKLSTRTKNKLQIILQNFQKGIDTKRLYSKRNKYTNQRLKIHNKIINKFLKQDTSTKKPDVYLLGGVAASGKTKYLQKLIKEKAVIINNDDIKKELAKINPSPIKKYLLLHAPLLHRESGDIENKLLTRVLNQNKDVVLDRTLANYSKNLKVVNRFRKKGYKLTTLGTNLYPHIALVRASKRLVHKGRYVPLGVIARKGNTINRNVLLFARKSYNKRSVVIDTQNRKGKIIYQR